MRKLNGALLLEIVREKGLVSRAELARLSGLTKPTVSSQVADLIRHGVLVEDGAGEPDNRGGKPPMLLRFNAAWGLVIAAEIASGTVRVWLSDLDGSRIDQEITPITPELGAGHILDTLLEAMRAVLARKRGRREKLRAIAVAAPGRVDAGSGEVLEAGNVFHWLNVDVSARIRGAFRVPVVVDNDVNLAALGEMHSGLARGVENFILIRLGTGVGAGLVLGGRVYQGAHWAAGEIAHMIFDRTSAAEGAKDRGYLELAIGSDRVRERVSLARANRMTAAAIPAGTDLAAMLRDAVQQSDPVAAQVVDDLASQLSLAVADMAAVLDPELIVLSGEMFGLVTDRIRDLVGQVIPWPIRIERSVLGEEGALMGALGSARGMAHDLICSWDRSPVQAAQT